MATKDFLSTAPWWAAWPAGWPKWPSRKSPGTTSPRAFWSFWARPRASGAWTGAWPGPDGTPWSRPRTARDGLPGGEAAHPGTDPGPAGIAGDPAIWWTPAFGPAGLRCWVWVSWCAWGAGAGGTGGGSGLLPAALPPPGAGGPGGGGFPRGPALSEMGGRPAPGPDPGASPAPAEGPAPASVGDHPDLVDSEPALPRREHDQTLLIQEARALELLEDYEARPWRTGRARLGPHGGP